MAHPNSKRAKAAKAKRAQDRKKSTKSDRSTAQQQRASREEHRDDTRRSRDRQVQVRKVRNVAIVAAIIGLAGFGIWSAFKPGPELDGVEKPPSRGAQHGNNATYDNPAPTSGTHSPNAVGCGTFSTPVPPDRALHSLEHGSVMLWFAADRPELGPELLAATSEYDSNVIISPNPGIESAIVATSWGRRKSYDEINDDLLEFVEIYRGRGLESVFCPRQ